MTKNYKKIAEKKYFLTKNHNGRPSYGRCLQPSKENIQQFKTLFSIIVSFWSSPPKSTRIHVDPDPQHRFLCRIGFPVAF
jgi:hypothetical protein